MNRPDNLYPCLRSIEKYCTGETYETFVVAYRFSAENLERARADFPRVKFIVSDEIHGFSENNNLALRQAKGEYCLLLNDDTELRCDLMSKLAGDFSRLPGKTAIVSPKLVNPDGSLQLCGRPRYPAFCYVLQQWHLYKEHIDDTVGRRPLFPNVFKTTNISGAAFMIKTELFRQFGWFDESYFFTPEDIALSVKAGRLGYEVYVDGDAEVVHKWKATASRLSPAIRPAAVRGSLMFFSDGSRLRYLLLAVPVWLAESAKFLKACLRCLFRPSAENLVKKRTFRENCRAIFSRKTPKQLFIEAADRWKLL